MFRDHIADPRLFIIIDIVDKTANYVARSGPQFEERIRENEKHNPKFCFMNPTDPYRAYYDYKIKEVREGRGKLPGRDECKTAWVICSIGR